MKVILLRDVAKIGKKSDVKEVPSGYALNFLIPQKLALPATPENMKKHSTMLQQKEVTRSKEEERFLTALAVVREKNVHYYTEANEKGHLYKSVGVETLRACLSENGGVFTKEEIQLEQPIKALGEYEIVLRHGMQSGVCRIIVCKK